MPYSRRSKKVLACPDAFALSLWTYGPCCLWINSYNGLPYLAIHKKPTHSIYRLPQSLRLFKIRNASSLNSFFLAKTSQSKAEAFRSPIRVTLPFFSFGKFEERGKHHLLRQREPFHFLFILLKKRQPPESLIRCESPLSEVFSDPLQMLIIKKKRRLLSSRLMTLFSCRKSPHSRIFFLSGNVTIVPSFSG